MVIHIFFVETIFNHHYETINRYNENMGIIGQTILITSLLIFFLLILPLAIVFIVFSINDKYKKFILEHSEAIKELNKINNSYQFNKISNQEIKSKYDNEDYYNIISPKDYLIYYLNLNKDYVLKMIKATNMNRELYNNSYIKDINNINVFDSYDIDKKPINHKKLIKMEKELFDRRILHPTIEYSIAVTIIRTNINGEFEGRKKETFKVGDIKTIIKQLNQKRGDFYFNRDIWDALCRVERGKVTNKMRFLIYKRDGYRCRKCGSEKDLEIDHIVPIAKGGKSTLDNLQTLCKKCNKEKSSNIEYC